MRGGGGGGGGRIVGSGKRACDHVSRVSDLAPPSLQETGKPARQAKGFRPMKNLRDHTPMRVPT